MKKILSLAFAAATICAAHAADFTVYSNSSVAEGVAVNSWWNVIQNTKATNPDGEGYVWALTYNPDEPGGGATGPNFCAGLQAKSGTTVAGPLATATLTFKYYATTPCNIKVQVDADNVVQTATVSVSEDDTNKWNTASFSMTESFPKVSAVWNDWKGEGLSDILGLIVEQFNADTKVYINDVVYTGINESWVKPEVEAPVCPVPPVPATPADDVVSLFSGAYTAAATHTIGGWGQSTKAKILTAENGAPVYSLTAFNYLGWELNPRINVEDFDYMHVDFYAVTETPFAFTPISPGKEKAFIAPNVKTGEWNSYDVPLSHWDNVDFSDIFQVKFDKGNGGEGYIANVYFWKDTRIIPAVTATVSDITTDGATIAYKVTLPEVIADANISVKLNDVVYTENPIVLTGLNADTAYDYTLTVIAEKDGELYTAETPVSFKTLRDASNTPMWYGHVEKDTKNANMDAPVHLVIDYTMIANADNTLTIEATVSDNWKELPGLGGFQINILGDESEWGPSLTPDAEGFISRTTTRTFTDGEQVTGFFWAPYALMGERIDFAEPYYYASSNDKPVTAIRPRLTAVAEDITASSANIVYTVALPAEIEGAEVKVLLNGETALTESPYALTGLEQNTDYSYILKAIATLDGETYESTEQTVTFKTLRDGAKATHYYQIVNGIMPNNYKVGETEADRRQLPVSMMTEIIYNTDQTVTVNFTVNGADDIVGFVPGVNIGGQWSGSLAGKAVDGLYSWTTPDTFEDGKNLHSYFWFQFPGGVQGIDMKDFTLGESNEPVSYGAPAGIVITTKNTDVTGGTPVALTCYAVDAAGNYLLNEEITLDVKEGDATIAGDFVTLPGRGTAVIEATCGELSAEITLNCLTSAEAINAAKGITGVASEFATNDPALATDDNEATQLEFNCAETQEHTFAIDLGKNHELELIEVVFEGASATAYTVTVERELNEATVARAKVETKVYTVTDGAGGAGVTARRSFAEATPVTGRYITLATSKAFDPTWGIKLKELRAFGTPTQDTLTGIENIDTEAAAGARFFRLDGIEVSPENLSAGVYVKLEGKTATKVFIR